MSLKRIMRHLSSGRAAVRSAFPPRTLDAIERAIRETEAKHNGQIRFAVEAALELAPLLAGQTAQQRALEVFSKLRVWDTEHNNGVLIYLLLADRDVEIVADRGIHTRLGQETWETICRE
ncbi:MAG: TPM domain-containing protein, partial [Betaproteobacteria bacterium]|nr:TPM domain-containing protein [Betaproteobacteria bacterium]